MLNKLVSESTQPVSAVTSFCNETETEALCTCVLSSKDSWAVSRLSQWILNRMSAVPLSCTNIWHWNSLIY